ncbi:exosome component 10-like protein [Carex littledalei]|uniref:Exosome component 10-like protein n=1 Tax=Carex littledalei TaxID=544730 RepID=A0A833VKE2_9POAL|nr:exosome component 10-like protein [Carex littledalei]
MKLSARSKGIPSGEDFHFYHNFPEFKTPARDIAAVSGSSLSSISDSKLLWRNQKNRSSFPANDQDDALDWVINVNDELLERFGASMDEFKEGRTKEEEIAKEGAMDDDGFQLVCGKNKKKSAKEESVPGSSYSATGVSVATKDRRIGGAKPKVPFHIPSIPRPQDEYRIIVNNANLPFQHVWLEQSEDGTRLIHPLEKAAAVDFVDRKGGIREPMKPLSLGETPFKLVEELKDLREMCTKLKSATEFAVDLEHNQYRSFQGLTCLMQISTRTEDFIVDTLKLRIYIGSYLREIFKDPYKRKVMHGADRDIVWLQRDFGIYVVNLFDTGQASRVLQLERNSLEYLLHHFCDVEANKEYQNADWRLRPLPKEMLKYAREDTHYLLYIYDVMRNQLLSESLNGYDRLLEVYNRSSEICLQMYEKELLTDTSFMNIYGLWIYISHCGHLLVMQGLCHWRDYVARADDESTGYILPNKTLLEIAKEMPLTSDKLLRLVKLRHSVVERHLPAVLDIIRNSISNSPAFEAIAMQLKQAQVEKVYEAFLSCFLTSSTFAPFNTSAMVNYSRTYPSNISSASQRAPFIAHQGQKPITASLHVSEAKSSATVSGSASQQNISSGSTQAVSTLSSASVQLLKRPAAFGALFGKPSASGKKPSSAGSLMQQEDAKTKVEKIQQAVALPFNFSGVVKQRPAEIKSCEVVVEAPPAPSSRSEAPSTALSSQPESMQLEEPSLPPSNAVSINMEDMIPLDDGGTDSPTSSTSSPTKNPGTSSASSEDDESAEQKEWFPRQTETTAAGSESEADMPVSPTELSSSFEKCFKSLNELKGSKQTQLKPNQENNASFQLKPFNYAAARKDIQFGESKGKGAKDNDEEEGGGGGGRFRKPKKGGYGEKNNSKRSSSGQRGEKEGGFQQPRRRQAFPLTGNRSITYI